MKCRTDLESIKETALASVQEQYKPGDTFKVSTKGLISSLN
ncbi:hypothetical protein PO124_09695 [Bacillus licheniformis]|nr:hypothetical protein [Bacillus licheniformis]